MIALVRLSQKFSPRRRPLLGVRDGQNLISWRQSLPLPTNPVWWGSMHAISSYHRNRPTHTHTQTHPQRQDRLQYTAPQLVRNVKMYVLTFCQPIRKDTHSHGILPTEQLIVFVMAKVLLTDRQNYLPSTSATQYSTSRRSLKSSVHLQTLWVYQNARTMCHDLHNFFT